MALHAETILLSITSDSTYHSSVNYSPILGFDSFRNFEVVQTDKVMELKKTAEDYLDNVKLSLGAEAIEIVIK